MRKLYRIFILPSVLAVLVLSVVGTPFIGQVTAVFDVNELEGFVPGDLIIVEPQNTTYIDVVPLNVVTSSGNFELNSLFYDCPLWNDGYSYSIDGQDNVTISAGTFLNTTLTSLDSGGHCIVVYTYFYVAWGQLAGPYCYSSESVYFSVIKTDVTIHGPHNKTTVFVLSVSVMSAAIICSMIVMYKKHMRLNVCKINDPNTV